MPAPNDRHEDASPKAGKTKSNTDEATIQAEEELQDAETAREAMDEARKLDAVPFERLKEDPEP